MPKAEYPYFVQPFSKIEGSRFVDFYMSDQDIRTIKKMFPGGAVDEIDPWYTMFPEGNLDDELKGIKRRSPAVGAARELKDHFWPVRNQWTELLHKGYQVLIDARTLEGFAVVKGKIKFNQHTKYTLLKKMPPVVEKAINAYTEYIAASRELVANILG